MLSIRKLQFMLFLLRAQFSYYILTMNPENQIEKEYLTIDDNTFINQNQVIAYGLWSRYNPLSTIVQVGQVGIFDSNCFHYHNAANTMTKEINFVYYDCLDSENKLITKNVKFVDDMKLEHHFSIQLENDLYENIWYYFQMTSWPYASQFQLIFLQNTNVILYEKLELKYPFYDKELILTFGGGANSYYGASFLKYSYFPGKLALYPLELSEYEPQFDFQYNILDSFRRPFCSCEINWDWSVIQSQMISINDLSTYQSYNPNCDYFQLAGWLKIDKIVKTNPILKYKVLKITTDSQSNVLTNDNLSPFCLYYQITDQGNKIIFTTYSYNFPSVNIDFTANPNLITTEIDLDNNIYLWHYFIVILQNDELSVTIKFFEGSNIFEYQQKVLVKQFHIVVFQIQLGNLEWRQQEYLILEAYQIQFLNCDFTSFEQGCHESCELCYGPTNLNCVTCKNPRIYLAKTQTCVCPYGSYESSCVTLEMTNLQTIKTEQELFSCKYGEFQVFQSCFLCPSIVNDQQISCIECLQNPKSWYQILQCKTSLVSHNKETYATETLTSTRILYFTFDGQSTNYCENCYYCQGEKCLSNQLVDKQLQKIKFCLTAGNSQCLPCTIVYCEICGLSLEQGIYCKKCNFLAFLVNGKCEVQLPGQQQYCFDDCSFCQGSCQACYPPLYLNSEKSACKACPIEYCTYCFMFQSNDLTQSTLYKGFSAFTPDEFTQIGCSLCNDGYNYDFISKKCIKGTPGILNCLRSYINLQGEEICVLSAIDDFKIAPQIVNCQLHIKNCKQCLLTETQSLKCIICEDGYSASVSTGQCDTCNIPNSINCIEGEFYLQDYWVQLIQSFMAQFLPGSYFYPKSQQFYLITQFPLSCQEGYQPNRNSQCTKKCDSNCLLCQEDYFYKNILCKQCKPTYYGDPNLSALGSTCLVCPKLCLACQPRELQEIQMINPYFQSSDSNIKYSYKCLKVLEEANIIIDPELQIAVYCYDNECSRGFSYTRTFEFNYFQFLLSPTYPDFYENFIDTGFCNFIGIREFTVKFILVQNSVVYLVEPVIIFTTLKSAIFSLQETSLILFGDVETINNFQIQLSIQDFDKVTIENIQFEIFTGNRISIMNRNLPVDLSMTNALFYSWSDAILLDNEFQISVHRNLNLTNITMSNLHLKDMVWFEYVSDLNEETIEIVSFQIYNCYFQNVTLFFFKTYSKPINITIIDIYNSSFQNSTFIKFGTRQVISEQGNFFNINLEESTFNYSVIIQNEGNYLMNLIYLQIYANQFIKSTVISSVQNVELQNVTIKKNKFISSFFFKADFQTSIQNFYIFNYFKLAQNQFIDSSLFYIHQVDQEQNKIMVKFYNFDHFQLINSEANDRELTFLYDIECWEVKVNNFTINQPWNLPYFRIYQTFNIQFENVFYKSNEQPFKISTQTGCLQNTISSPLLIHIQGFAKIQLYNISIINQFSIDYSLIHILSDILYVSSDIEVITIKDIYIYGNILLKNNLGNILSLIVIYSDRLQQITLNNITFIENFFNQIVDDPSQMTSGLLFINSQQSAININTLKCLSNGITNSSYTFIVINSLSINVNNYSVINSNLFDKEIWLNYYSIDTDYTITNDVINHLIQYLFFISTRSGAGQFAAQKITLINSLFNNLLALSNSVLQITTQGQGNIKINNISIINASVLLTQTIEVDGCLSINSQNSLLHLTIQNVYLESIKNRFGSAIITIYPSQKENQIKFINLTIFNCYSLINQFITVEFSKESNLQNQVIINNLNITTTEEGWDQYLSEISYPSNLEIKKITSINAIIQLNDCSIILNNFYITGLLITPIFIFNDNLKLLITNINIIDIQILFPFHLIQLSQTKSNQNTLIMQQLKIQNASQLFKSKYNQLVQIHSMTSVDFECVATQINITQYPVNQTIDLLIEQLNENSEQQGSLINIQSISKFSIIRLNSIDIIYNNCSFCYQGLMYISSISDKVKIQSLNCYKNQIAQQGCLYLINKQSQQANLIAIKNSAFIKNNGQQGVGVYSSQILFKIKKGYFIENKCTNLGGAVYAEKISNNFIFEDSFVINNKANIGGGIALTGFNYLNYKNFVNSLNLFNLAQLYSNNLVEAPHHLDLNINNLKMASSSFIEQNDTIQQLQFKPYETIQQGIRIKTDLLLLPSGQSISDYRLFFPQQLISLNYISDFSIVFKNSINEELQGNQGDQCGLLQRTPRNSENFQNISTLKFDLDNNRFDLSLLSVNIDPYTDKDEVTKLRFQCKSQYNLLIYQINTRAFQCQLGEFYVSNECQVCQSNYGFYSVTYNTTKCSIFDKTKLKNITSNNLDILPGYWRPNRLSDATEECFKNHLWCIGGWGVGNEICYSGHVGGLCEECDIYNTRGDGYYFKTSSKTCMLCENENEMLLPVLIVIIWTFLTTLLTLKSINTTNKVFAILKAQNKLFEILFKLTQGIIIKYLDFESIILKMFLNYFWIFSVIFTFNITFGFSLNAIDQANNPSFVMAVSLDCQYAKSTSIQLIYFRLITMILFILLQVLVISGGFKLHSFLSKKPYDLSIISNTVIYLFVSNHASLINNLSSLISSRTISEIQYVQGNVNLLFSDDEHIKWIYAFILPGLIIFGFAIPVLLFITLFFFKKKFNQSLFRKYLGYLYNEFNKETYYWEQIKLWKRSIIIFIMTYFETNISIKSSFINLTLICYLFLAINSKPYIIKSLNQLDVQSGLIVSMTLFLAEVKYISEQNKNLMASMLLQVIILLLCLRLCISFLFRMLRQYIKKYKLLVLQMLYHIFSFIKGDSYLTLYFQQQLTMHRQRRQQLQQNYEKLRQCLIKISKLEIQRYHLL